MRVDAYRLKKVSERIRRRGSGIYDRLVRLVSMSNVGAS